MKNPLSPALQAFAAITLALAAAGAQAQSSANALYGEIGWSQITYKESGYSINPSVLRALIGTEVHPNLAIEGMFGFGIADDSVRIGSSNVKGEIDSTWGVFIKPKLALTPDLDAFVRLGYAKTKLSVSVPGYRISDTGGDISYGVGASSKLSKQVSANVDYMSYYNKDNVKGTGLTLGLGLNF